MNTPSSLQIIDGKFYKSGVVVPVEFGNIEQINCLQSSAKVAEALMNGIEVYPDFDEIVSYKATFNFKCICGKHIFREDEDAEDEDDIEGLVISSINCKCGRIYKSTANKNKTLTVKLVTKTPHSLPNS